MSDRYIDQIEETIRQRSLLKHPFYQAWSNGSLPMESLDRYAGQYYHFESAYPTFLSGLHHRCADRGIRQLLLDNLWDEEHGEENHVELWLRFCEGLGIGRDDVQATPPAEETAALGQRLQGAYLGGSGGSRCGGVVRLRVPDPRGSCGQAAGGCVTSTASTTAKRSRFSPSTRPWTRSTLRRRGRWCWLWLRRPRSSWRLPRPSTRPPRPCGNSWTACIRPARPHVPSWQMDRPSPGCRAYGTERRCAPVR